MLFMVNGRYGTGTLTFQKLEPEPEPEPYSNFSKVGTGPYLSKVRTGTVTVKNSYGSATLAITSRNC